MCLPVTDQNGAVDVSGDLRDGQLSLKTGLQDLEVNMYFNIIYIPKALNRVSKFSEVMRDHAEPL